MILNSWENLEPVKLGSEINCYCKIFIVYCIQLKYISVLQSIGVYCVILGDCSFKKQSFNKGMSDTSHFSEIPFENIHGYLIWNKHFLLVCKPAFLNVIFPSLLSWKLLNKYILLDFCWRSALWFSIPLQAQENKLSHYIKTTIFIRL